MHSQKTLLPILITSTTAFHFIIICKYIFLAFVIIHSWENDGFLLETDILLLEDGKHIGFTHWTQWDSSWNFHLVFLTEMGLDAS